MERLTDKQMLSHFQIGWVGQTRYDGLGYAVSDEKDGNVKLTISSDSEKLDGQTLTVSSLGDLFYRRVIDRSFPVDGWEYLGETDYNQVYRHIKTGKEIFQHAIGGDVLSLTEYLPLTDSVATAMRHVEAVLITKYILDPLQNQI